MRRSVATAALASLTATMAAAEIDSIVAKGSHFFMSKSGEQFYIKGIAYQQGVSAAGGTSKGSTPDPLADPAGCKRDIPLLKELETNLVRVYSIDPTADHDECMSMLADAGMYVLADLASSDISINTFDPSWTDEIYNRYISVVDALQKYPNTFGFFAGNEVVTNNTNSDAAAYAKAAVRDTKAYIKARGYREGLGVGYAADDNAEVRTHMADYLNCGSTDDSVDFLGLNIYEWCASDATFQTSGYADRVKEFQDFDKPVFFSEYGCNTDPPRLFKDVPVLMGPQMDAVFSGGIVFMYFQETNDYGLVNQNGNSVSKLQPDFDNLSKEIRLAHPSTTQMGSYQPTNSAASCPAVGGSFKSAPSPLPPSPNPELCSCMVSSLSCVVSDDTDPQDYGDLFSYACSHAGNGACAGILHDSTKGSYGAYSMCSAKEQLSWAFNQYASKVGGSDACSFKGAAQSQQAKSPSGQCKSLLAQAGPSGTNTVKASPVATGTADAGSGASTTTSGAASAVAVPALDLAVLRMGASVLVAFGAGVGLMWL